jgi:hypothetical protein
VKFTPNFEQATSPDIHQLLIDFLANVRHEYDLSGRLGKLRGWRNQCDYDDNYGKLFERIDDAFRYSDYIIEKCC